MRADAELTRDWPHLLQHAERAPDGVLPVHEDDRDEPVSIGYVAYVLCGTRRSVEWRPRSTKDEPAASHRYAARSVVAPAVFSSQSYATRT